MYVFFDDYTSCVTKYFRNKARIVLAMSATAELIFNLIFDVRILSKNPSKVGVFVIILKELDSYFI